MTNGIRVITDIKQVQARLDRMATAIPRAIDSGLGKWAIIAHRAALKNLSGSKSDAAGSYPVPVRTGNLRRSDDYVLPLHSKHGIFAAHGQAYLVNTAGYAHAIHEGEGTNASHSPRRFEADAVESTHHQGLDVINASIRAIL